MTETATLAGGCFWCTEAIFKRLKGVLKVTPGYSGGVEKNANYTKVGSENTNHAESIQIEFNQKIISYEKILEVFFKTHDPTSLNRQGNDVGPQYRSEIFYHYETQKKIAKELVDKLNQETYDGKIVTQISPYQDFFEAEDYHQDYYEKNKGNAYCTVVIDPKIQKLSKNFGDLVKD